MQASFADTTLRLAFESDLLSTNVARHRALLLAALDAHPAARLLVADLARVGTVDSQGLNLLVALLRETERRSLAFRVENPSPDVRRMFLLLNLGPRFGLAPAPKS